MNARQLQEAIDKTRLWLTPQVHTQSTPSFKAKDDAVAYLSELQKIQVVRAGMVTTPRTTLKDIK